MEKDDWLDVGFVISSLIVIILCIIFLSAILGFIELSITLQIGGALILIAYWFQGKLVKKRDMCLMKVQQKDVRCT